MVIPPSGSVVIPTTILMLPMHIVRESLSVSKETERVLMEDHGGVEEGHRRTGGGG